MLNVWRGDELPGVRGPADARSDVEPVVARGAGEEDALFPRREVRALGIDGVEEAESVQFRQVLDVHIIPLAASLARDDGLPLVQTCGDEGGDLDGGAVEGSRAAAVDGGGHDDDGLHPQRKTGIDDAEFGGALRVGEELVAVALVGVDVVVRVVEDFTRRVDVGAAQGLVGQVRRPGGVEHPDIPSRGLFALGEAFDEGRGAGGVEAKGRVDDDVVLGGDLGGAGCVVEVLVEDRTDPVAVGVTEFLQAVLAPDETGDG